MRRACTSCTCGRAPTVLRGFHGSGRRFPTALPWAVNGMPRWGGCVLGWGCPTALPWAGRRVPRWGASGWGRRFPTALPWAVNRMPRWGGSGLRRSILGWDGRLGCRVLLRAHRRCISLASPRQRRGIPPKKREPPCKGTPNRPYKGLYRIYKGPHRAARPTNTPPPATPRTLPSYCAPAASALGISPSCASHSRDCVCHASHMGPL